jgi:hypothetical protein
VQSSPGPGPRVAKTKRRSGAAGIPRQLDGSRAGRVLDEHLRQEVCWRGARDRRGGCPTHEPVEDERTEAQTDLVGGLKRIGAQPGRARARQGDAVLGCACLLRKWMLMNRGGTPGEQATASTKPSANRRMPFQTIMRPSR